MYEEGEMDANAVSIFLEGVTVQLQPTQINGLSLLASPLKWC